MVDSSGEKRKGFSGLSDLVSDVSDIDEPVNVTLDADIEAPVHTGPPQPRPTATTAGDKGNATESRSRPATADSSKGPDISLGKWTVGILGFVLVVWWFNSADQSNKQPSYNPPSVSQTRNSQLTGSTQSRNPPSESARPLSQYAKPPVGTGNLLSTSNIRWCIRESIRIDARRGLVYTNAGIREFNSVVSDYNSRCGRYKYRQGSQAQAEREVEPHRSQISTEAMRDQRAREVQRLLTTLGYDPGPVDGKPGKMTAEAVKAFQRSIGSLPDGKIDEQLVRRLVAVVGN